jgi:hypothetical protein
MYTKVEIAAERQKTFLGCRMRVAATFAGEKKREKTQR